MTAVRQSATGQLESRILAQMIKIIVILIATADRKNTGADDAAERMRHPFRITLVWKQTAKPFDDPNTLLRQGQQGHATIR